MDKLVLLTLPNGLKKSTYDPNDGSYSSSGCSYYLFCYCSSRICSISNCTARSHDNILENNIFSNIQSNEYSLSGDSSIIIREQHFDNALIAQEGSATENVVEIVDSGIIEVTEGETDEDDDDDGGGDEEEEEGEGELYNTYNEPFRRTLSDGDSITVNSL